MSIQSFLNTEGHILKVVATADFFDRFTNDDFELGIEIIRKDSELELVFISIERNELMAFCILNSIMTVTYFAGEKTKNIVRLSRER